ncbi:MAG: tyrosine--tRNA ligase [Gemmatimonadaceae bacterium]|nr:tyrosine--tRNA ligase [Gemmatimonadaceae bacterium]
MAESLSLLDELSWRGLLYQHTDGIADWLRDPRGIYAGFDPTAASLHVGSMVPIMGLVHAQRAGHRPVALVGGGTGLIGDPGGKTTERALMTLEQVEENARGIRAQLEHFLDFSGASAARMRNNADWLLKLGALDLMRDVGKHFTVNYMLAKDSVQSRLDAGISYTEFSYMLLQAYDFLELKRGDEVSVQLGGSDQWGNMTAGMELIRRSGAGEAHVLTMPLMMKADGTKFGKSEGGAVWLDPQLTSPYRFYQFWVNADDRDVGRLLRYFSLLPRAEIEALERDVAEHPEKREAQRALARDVTARLHGVDAARVAAEVSGLLFGGADARSLSGDAVEALSREITTAEAPLPAASADVLDLLVSTSLAASRGAAKRLVEQGGVYVNGARITMAARTIDEGSLLAGGHALLRKGARDYALVRFVSR